MRKREVGVQIYKLNNRDMLGWVPISSLPTYFWERTRFTVTVRRGEPFPPNPLIPEGESEPLPDQFFSMLIFDVMVVQPRPGHTPVVPVPNGKIQLRLVSGNDEDLKYLKGFKASRSASRELVIDGTGVRV